jgi:hypothetical protein
MQTLRETRPNRRYRRLIPAALTGVVLSVGSTGVAHAASPRPARQAPVHVRPGGPPVAVMSRPRTTDQQPSGRVTGT